MPKSNSGDSSEKENSTFVSGRVDKLSQPTKGYGRGFSRRSSSSIKRKSF
jgi:hypothetical protein